MPKTPLSPWQAHVAAWKNCTKCELHRRRNFVCLARGELPCDILFIGEAPGRSEDLIELSPGCGLGTPFVGPAGKLLDSMVDVALGPPGRRPRLCFTNLVGCIPLEDDGEKAGEPDPVHIRACAPRLQEIVRLSAAKLIVCVGSLARRHLDRSVPGDRPFSIDIDHPARILREPAAFRNLMRQRAEVRLRNAAARMHEKRPTLAREDAEGWTVHDDIPF